MPPLFHRGGGSSITPLVYVMLETEGSLYTHGDPSVIRPVLANDTSPKGEDKIKGRLEVRVCPQSR
jgi:hypothetical protein